MRDQPTSELAESVNAHSLQRLVSGHGLSHLDLFSGIGGFALAARMNEVQTVAFVEKDEYAQKVLRKNFAGIPIYDDICNFDGTKYSGVWLLTGGFPCQPFSLAGKRLGKEDDRHLWPQMLRVIKETRPTWVLGENVPGIISMELDSVLSDLESLGYSAWPLTVPACATDARHRRDRLWVVAYSTQRQDNGRNGGSLDDTTGRGESINPATDSRRENVAITDRLNGRARTGRKNGAQSRNDGEMVSNSNGVGQSGSRQHERCEHPKTATAWQTSRTDNRGETEQPSEWQPEPELGRVANGIPNRMDRLKGLGNAIVPQVAAQLIRQMRMTANKKLSDGSPTKT